MTPSSPPSSPTKSTSQALLQKLFTGITPIDPQSHQQRWNPSPSGSPGRVASIVKDYEKNSLDLRSRPYEGLPFNSSPGAKGKGTPVVQAGLFQQRNLGDSTAGSAGSGQNQLRNSFFSPPTPTSSSTASKENTRPLPSLPLQSYLPPQPTPQIRKQSQPPPPAQKQPQSQPPSLTKSDSTTSSDLETHEHAFIGFAEPVFVNSPPSRTSAALVQPSHPYTTSTPLVQPTRVTTTRPVSVPAARPPFNIEREVSRERGTRERLPSSPAVVRDSEREVQRKDNLGLPTEGPPSTSLKRRSRASTLNSSPIPPPPSAISQGTISLESSFEELLDSLNLPANSTIRKKMMSLPPSLKTQMLANHNSTPSSTSFRGHKRNQSSSAASTTTPVVTKRKSFVKGLLKKSKSSTSLIGLENEVEVEVDGDAVWWGGMIRTKERKDLDPKVVGKLRGRLRSEKVGWVEEFLKNGGGKGLVERLDEVLFLEWREEQHDDQLIYEVLRCFLALTLSLPGIAHLRQTFPHPFIPLTSLLFSPKRPGDIICRQVIVDLIQSLFILLPSGEKIGVVKEEEWKSCWFGGDGDEDVVIIPTGVKRYTRPTKKEEEEGEEERRRKMNGFVWSLMMGPPDFKKMNKLEFGKKSRVFKHWVGELGDLLRDYFWIFCHQQNQIWNYEKLDGKLIGRPKVPSGMTGGVESEAMAYAASHFKLINTLASTCPSSKITFEFHSALFISGFERVIMVLRRSSQVYYPTLHLEISHYVHLARKVGFNLGPRILGCLDCDVLGKEEKGVVKGWDGGSPVIDELKF